MQPVHLAAGTWMSSSQLKIASCWSCCCGCRRLVCHWTPSKRAINWRPLSEIPTDSVSVRGVLNETICGRGGDVRLRERGKPWPRSSLRKGEQHLTASRTHAIDQCPCRLWQNKTRVMQFNSIRPRNTHCTITNISQSYSNLINQYAVVGNSSFLKLKIDQFSHRLIFK